MAQSRISSNAPDWRDVAAAAGFMQRSLGIVVTIRAEMSVRHSPQSILWIAEAWRKNVTTGVVELWASSSVSMLVRGGGGTDAAHLLLLYELDRDCYRRMNEIAPQL